MKSIKPHADAAELLQLFPSIEEYQRLARKHGINDIFQDNGGKLLQMLLLLGLTALKKREGNDAKDDDGNEYELKSVNASLTKCFSTHHHLNPSILTKYRKVDWFFAVYDNITLKTIYYMDRVKLEPLFAKWEQQWNATKKDINNPKINLSFVQQHGVLVWPAPQPLEVRTIPDSR